MIIDRTSPNRPTLLLVAAVGIIAACLIGPTPARATSYSVRTCDAFTANHMSFGQNWSIGDLNDGIFPVNDCPAGIRFDPGQVTAQGDSSVTWFRPDSDSVLKSARFEYYGGDTSGDFRYTVRSCEFLCDELLELTPGATKAAPSLAELTIPEGVESNIALEALCVRAFCADPPELVAKNFNLEYSDDVAPAISDMETDPAGILDPDPVVWARGTGFELYYRAYDSGSGVALSDIWLDNTRIAETGFSSDDASGAALYGRGYIISKRIAIEGAADGQHDLMIVVIDGTSGMPGVLMKHFDLHIDNTPPGEPLDLALSDNVTKWGWTPEPEIAVSHADATLDAKNTEFSGFSRATFDLRSGPNAQPATSVDEPDPSAPATLNIPHEGLWNAGVTYTDNAGNRGNRGHITVGFDSDTPEPADPVPHDWITLSALHGGVNQTWTAPPEDADLESGICGYAYRVDDEPFTIPEANADVAAPTTSAVIPSGIGEGTHFVHIRAIACNGKASSTETVPVNVDGTPPTPTLHGAAVSTDWQTSRPQISLSATDALSGVAALEYGFDGPGSLNLVPGSSTAITVPPGDQTLTYRAIDVAGNVSPLVERRIRSDWNLPAAEFSPTNPERPNVLTASVLDYDSGLAGVGMQIRRTDTRASALEKDWRPLGDLATPSPVGKKSEVFSRAVPDGEFPDGSYEVRITARDVAGNWLESGSTLRLQLPLRAKPSLSAAIARVGRKSKVNWSGATQDRVIRFGERAALVGTLLDTSGNPVAGAPIAISATPEFGTPERLPGVTTDARGEFVVRLPNGPTRRFALRYEGNDRIQPIDQTATIRSRAALEIRVTPRTVHSEQPFWISGRLLSGSLGLPEGGKVVSIEFLMGRIWTPTVQNPRVDSKGRFKAKWPPGIKANRPTTVYFRVKAKRDSTWPFLSGSSEPFAVRVKP